MYTLHLDTFTWIWFLPSYWPLHDALATLGPKPTVTLNVNAMFLAATKQRQGCPPLTSSYQFFQTLSGALWWLFHHLPPLKVKQSHAGPTSLMLMKFCFLNGVSSRFLVLFCEGMLYNSEKQSHAKPRLFALAFSQRINVYLTQLTIFVHVVTYQLPWIFFFLYQSCLLLFTP